MLDISKETAWIKAPSLDWDLPNSITVFSSTIVFNAYDQWLQYEFKLFGHLELIS
jgi:hypothetical protein